MPLQVFPAWVVGEVEALLRADFFTMGVHRLRRRWYGGRKWNYYRNMQGRPYRHRVKKPSGYWGTRMSQALLGLWEIWWVCL